ncbi:hypothetical protein [Oceanobacillus salinisoli]|uniref:hypothetical protein n=1 Tax=Oceanobacillus salinisoli TaxID=2678611 RepID=UPI0012E0D9F0|nr:hypothetical protein [Oceanobacillus salinisoli]
MPLCPYCNREPKEIPEYVELANRLEMSPAEYVRMDEGTYHLQTDLFCCTDCYIKQGLPLNTDLIHAFRRYRAKVLEFERR